LFLSCFQGKHENSSTPPSPYHSLVGTQSSKGSPFGENVEGDALAKVRHVVGGKTQLELECQVIREHAYKNPTIEVVSLLWRRVRVRRDELPRVQVEEVRNRSVPRVLRRLRSAKYMT